MDIRVYSASDTFKKYFAGLQASEVEFHSSMNNLDEAEDGLYFLHISSLGAACLGGLKQLADSNRRRVVLCADKPVIVEMLEAVRLGASAYCNSYMHVSHYGQLIRLVENGQSWFPPEMLSQTFALAHKALQGSDLDALLEPLTRRERDIALAVARGLSNRVIAQDLTISEQTVKAHLGNIFKKLQLKDRVALVLYLK